MSQPVQENPSQVHGRLNEALHVAGYAVERAWSKLEWLLEGERWKEVGSGFEDVNDFMATVQLPPGADPGQRKAIAKRIKELQPSVSQRKIAGTLGVSEATVGRDLGTRSAGGTTDDAPDKQDRRDSATPGEGGATDDAPAPIPRTDPPPPTSEITGEEAARAAADRVTRKRKDREREAKREANERLVEQAEPLPAPGPGQRFQAVVLDPPWDWGDEGDVSQFGRGDPTYATMPFDEVASLPVPDLVEENAHIYLWITNRSLPKGFALLEGWGFRYLTTLTWVKPSIGMGNYFRGSTEHVLFGVRGSLPLLRRDVGTHFTAHRPGPHSAKPDEFYKLVESCSPGPWLDMFARKERSGWVTWGAEVANAG